MTMEERMTVCNMSIEAGARAGMIAPDDTTYRYLDAREIEDFEAKHAAEMPWLNPRAWGTESRRLSAPDHT